MSVLSGLKPADVFDYFEKLCAVPHGSGNTKAISDLCAGFARELGLKYRQDDANNLVIWKEASPGYEGLLPSSSRATWTWSAPRRRTAPRIWRWRDWT